MSLREFRSLLYFFVLYRCVCSYSTRYTDLASEGSGELI